MVLTKQRSAWHFDIRIGKTNIEQVNEIKYLGVIFNDKLSWKSHIQHVCSKLSNGSWKLLKLRNYVDTTTLKTVYYALMYSYLQYCVSTWGLASTTALDPLVRIHKCIIRIITNCPFLSHTNPLFQKLNFLKLKDIVKLEIAKTTFCFNKSSAKNESQTIISITQKHHYKTRLAAKQNYFQPRKRTELGKKTFSYIGPEIWQEVPYELKSLSYNQFKKKFKLFLTNQY